MNSVSAFCFTTCVQPNITSAVNSSPLLRSTLLSELLTAPNCTQVTHVHGTPIPRSRQFANPYFLRFLSWLFTNVEQGLKDKFVTVHNMMAYERRRSLAPHTLNLGARWRWVINCTLPIALSPGKDPSAHGLGGWVGPRASIEILEERDISCPWRVSNLRSSSL